MEPAAPSEIASAAVSMADADRVAELQADHGPALFNFARHLGLSDDQAADVVQEGLLRLWRELRRGTDINQPLGWLYRTVYRLAMGQHRLRRRLELLLPRLASRGPEYRGPESSDRVVVWNEVGRLPERQRQVLYLRYAADMPFDRVAAILGISSSAARTHASRGVAALREALTQEVIS